MSFATKLGGLIRKAGVTRYRLTEKTDLDGAYVHRLASGERDNPSRDIVISLGMGLMALSEDITIHDVNDLLLSAEHAPLRKKHALLA